MAKLTVPEQHQLKIAKDTLRNPMKALLGSPSVAEAQEIVARLTGARVNAKMLKFPGVPCDACGTACAVADMCQCRMCGERQCQRCWECACDRVAREVVQRASAYTEVSSEQN